MHSPEKWEIKRGVLRLTKATTEVVVRLDSVHCARVSPMDPELVKQSGATGFLVQLIYASNSTAVPFDTLDEANHLADRITAFMVTGTGQWTNGNWEDLPLEAGAKTVSQSVPLTDETETGVDPLN